MIIKHKRKVYSCLCLYNAETIKLFLSKKCAGKCKLTGIMRLKLCLQIGTIRIALRVKSMKGLILLRKSRQQCICGEANMCMNKCTLVLIVG